MTKRVLLVVGFLLAIGMAATLIAGPARVRHLAGGRSRKPPAAAARPAA